MPTDTLAPTAPSHTLPHECEYLVFRVGLGEYGVNILRVQEIRTYEKPTALANMPDILRGVINLRGHIVPLIDMRLKFRQTQALCTDMTVVIVLNLDGRIVGAVVDSVSDVVRFSAEQLQSPPDLGNGLQPGHITALGSIDQRLLMLLDINKLLHGEEALRTYTITH